MYLCTIEPRNRVTNIKPYGITVKPHTMKTNSTPATRVKKEWKRGTVTQKMMTFRVDNENAEWLESKANKGRYINELIDRDRNRKK